MRISIAATRPGLRHRAAGECLLILILSVCVAPPSIAEPARPENAVIERLIAQLAHPNFKVREAAAKQLKGMKEARPFLQRALSSSDAEVAKLAGAILKDLHSALDPSRLDVLRRYAASGRIDIALLGYTTIDTAQDDVRFWKFGAEVAASIHGKACKAHGGDVADRALLGFDWLNDSLVAKSKTFRVCDRFDEILRAPGCIRANAVEVRRHPGPSLFAARDRLTVFSPVEAVLISAGSTTAARPLRSLVICDGDIHLAHVRDSVVIARGDVAELHDVHNSIVICSGRLREEPNVVSKSYVRGNVAKPLGFIRWFSTAEVGVVTTRDGDAITIAMVDDDKPFAKAGCKVGDRVAAVDGQVVKSLDEFRRAVMRGVLEGRAKFTLVRDGKSLDVTVPLALKD